MELPDEVGSDMAGGGQDPKEIPTRGWSERVSEASRILPKTPGRERISGLDRKTDSFGGGRSWFGHGAVTSRLELGG